MSRAMHLVLTWLAATMPVALSACAALHPSKSGPGAGPETAPAQVVRTTPPPYRHIPQGTFNNAGEADDDEAASAPAPAVRRGTAVAPAESLVVMPTFLITPSQAEDPSADDSPNE